MENNFFNLTDDEILELKNSNKSTGVSGSLGSSGSSGISGRSGISGSYGTQGVFSSCSGPTGTSGLVYHTIVMNVLKKLNIDNLYDFYIKDFSIILKNKEDNSSFSILIDNTYIDNNIAENKITLFIKQYFREKNLNKLIK